jgi:uncharacterized protein (TIGR03437 family)
MRPAALLLLAVPLAAAPVLRLSNSAVVAQVGVGANAAPQTIQTNAGDGALALSVSPGAGAAWLYASVQLGGNILFAFFTASLPRGTYTATVTVSDPDAIDSPQVVTVTVIVGSAGPYKVERYVAPGTNTSIQIFPNPGSPCTGYPAPLGPCLPGLTASTQDGGKWLAVSVGSNNTLNLNWTAWVYLKPAATMPDGTYNGSVAISGTSDDHAIPVTMHVTTQPVAVPSTTQVSLRLAQGAPAMTAPFLPPITFSNSGMGALVIQDVTASGTAVSAVNDGGAVVVTVDPGSLAPGTYNDGSVTIQCNAANCPIQVPVSLQVIPRGPPLIFYQGVVDNATFYHYPLAPGDVAVVFGEQLSFSQPVSAPGFPMPTSLGGASVLINDVWAPLYYTSYGQIAFQVPSSIAPGTAVVQVIRDGEPGNQVTVQVDAVAPQIVVVTDAAYQIRDATHPTKPGEALILWCIGLGPTIPSVPDGTPAPADPLARLIATPRITGFYVGDIVPSFAGLAPGEAGVYQVNITVPDNAPMGTSLLSLRQGAWTASVYLAVD